MMIFVELVQFYLIFLFDTHGKFPVFDHWNSEFWIVDVRKGISKGRLLPLGVKGMDHYLNIRGTVGPKHFKA